MSLSATLEYPLLYNPVYLRRGILVAFHAVQGRFRRIDRKFGRVIATVREQSASIPLPVFNSPTHKNPWPIFTMGWTGEAAAASLTIDLEEPG